MRLSPYACARSRDLGRWLIAYARKETDKLPTPWDCAIAHKDAHGRLLLQGLPYIDGLCVGPKEWREVLNPSHQVTQKHKTMTQEEALVTIYAFNPRRLSAIERAREQVRACFAEMQEYW